MAKKFLILAFLLVWVGLFPVWAESSEIPDLLGTWTGHSVGHYVKEGYTNETAFTYVFVITDQEGRAFNGTLYESGIHGDITYGESGVISYDMKTLHLADHDKGYNHGYLMTPDTMELILLVDGEDALAEVCVLKKG